MFSLSLDDKIRLQEILQNAYRAADEEHCSCLDDIAEAINIIDNVLLDI